MDIGHFVQSVYVLFSLDVEGRISRYVLRIRKIHLPATRSSPESLIMYLMGETMI